MSDDYDFDVSYFDDNNEDYGNEDYYEEEGDEAFEEINDEGVLEEEKDFAIFDEDRIIDEKDIYGDFIKLKEKKTQPFLTKFERSRILGYRALQISLGAESTIRNLQENFLELIDPYKIALLELKNKVIPVKLRRFLGLKQYEEWNINEMEEM